MDLNKKFKHLFDNSPRTLCDNPIERSNVYREKLEENEIDVRPDFDVDLENQKEENKKEYMQLLAEIKAGSIGIKESILNSVTVEQEKESNFEILCSNINGIEDKTGWTQNSALRKRGFWGDVWSKVSNSLKLSKEDNNRFQLRRVYSKLLNLRGKYSGKNDQGIEKDIRDILSFELKCADISDDGSYYELCDKMNGANEFDKLNRIIEYYEKIS